jgi:hypothetical protein
VRCKMLAPSEHASRPPRPRPLRQTLLAAMVVIGATAFGAFILYFATEGLFLVAHQGAVRFGASVI